VLAQENRRNPVEPKRLGQPNRTRRIPKKKKKKANQPNRTRNKCNEPSTWSPRTNKLRSNTILKHPMQKVKLFGGNAK
jgi:hypothetical protein